MKKLPFILIAFFMISRLPAQWLTGSAQVKVNGRIQYDFVFLKRQHADRWQIGNEFRRVHLSAAGRLPGRFDYKVEVNMAHGQIGFRDMFIRYNSKKWGQIAVGAMPEPTGLAMATSSKYIGFLERPMLTSLENFRWGAGLHYRYDALFDKRGGIQLALTNKGKNTHGFLDQDLDKGLNVAGRLYAVPFRNRRKHYLIHAGVNGASRPPKDLIVRPEDHLAGKYAYAFPGAIRRVETGGEMAAVFNNVAFQAEYKESVIRNTIYKDFKVKGYYAQMSAFLTGEHRPYKKGAFGRVKPLHPVGKKHGTGAWEVLFRYSALEFSPDIRALNPGNPPALYNTALGINWYPVSHVRIMYNYLITNDYNRTEGKLTHHLLRFQVDF